MKRLLYTLLFFGTVTVLTAQTSISFYANGLKAGDQNTFREIRFMDPGKEGPNQIWDFSAVRFTGKEIVSELTADGAMKSGSRSGSAILLKENGYDYLMSSSADNLVETGYVKEKNVTLEYTDPLIRMKYPFFYGDSYTDPYTAVAYTSPDHRIDWSGDYSVSADAFGTLILPDRIIKDALRVKNVKKGLQISMCGSTEVNFTRYYWIAPGYRYPVMSMAINESRYRGGEPEIIRTGYVNLQQPGDNGVAATGDQGSKFENQDVSVIIFPNPFEEKLTYNYFLRKQLPVTIELYDITGKVGQKLVKNTIQPEGLHTGEIDAVSKGLTPGVYYLRFTFDKQVFVSKIVKI